MRKAVGWACIAAALVVLASCASAPKTPESIAPPEKELAQARALLQKADANSLGDFAPDDYAAGTNDLKSGEDSYEKDNAKSKQALDRAIQEFTTVIAKGGALRTAKLRDQSDASMKAADDLKASVAVKDDYAAAKEVYDRAAREDASGDMESAGRDFAQARDMFDAVAVKAKDKRDKAVLAQKDVDQALASSQQDAADAQKTLNDEGF